MISINSYPHIKNHNNIQGKRPAFRAVDVSDIMAKGDNALNENKASEALKFYSDALKQNPNEVVLYRKLGKTYHQLKDYSSAESHFSKYLEANPNETEVWIDLGETQRMSGYYDKAISSFKKAAELEPNNDLANRSILQAKNDKLAVFSPERAQKEKQEYAQKNLNAALQMTVNYMTPAYMQELGGVVIEFGKTASMGGTANIAQYENYKSKITVSDTYTYAAPQVIAAYLTHESVHAHDKDPYTSVREEQDAYEIATKFWIKHSKGVQDPEMDYAAELYQQSPLTLASRVEEIYELRDPSIAKTSPNHPPEKKLHFNFLKKKAAQQSLQTYDVIA